MGKIIVLRTKTEDTIQKQEYRYKYNIENTKKFKSQEGLKNGSIDAYDRNNY